MKAFWIPLCLLFFTPTVNADTCSFVHKVKVAGKSIKRNFKVLGTAIEGGKQLSFIWKEGASVSEAKHLNFFMKIVSAYDDAAQKNKCKSYKRLFFIYPNISYTIASSEINKIHNLKKSKMKMWEAGIMTRTQVAYVKN